jgi:hypothetical protein
MVCTVARYQKLCDNDTPFIQGVMIIMGHITGDIDISVEDPLSLCIEQTIHICGRIYAVYKKEEEYDGTARNRIRYVYYLREVPWS